MNTHHVQCAISLPAYHTMTMTAALMANDDDDDRSKGWFAVAIASGTSHSARQQMLLRGAL